MSQAVQSLNLRHDHSNTHCFCLQEESSGACLLETTPHDIESRTNEHSHSLPCEACFTWVNTHVSSSSEPEFETRSIEYTPFLLAGRVKWRLSARDHSQRQAAVHTNSHGWGWEGAHLLSHLPGRWRRSHHDGLLRGERGTEGIKCDTIQCDTIKCASFS